IGCKPVGRLVQSGGAEKLLGRGDMLFMAPDSSKLVRLQGCYVSDKELAALARYWKGARLAQQPVVPDDVVQQQLWQEIEAAEQEEAHTDELLPTAIDLVRDQQRASISMLQRQLRIGYSRAARLIETMEQQGIIGPKNSGSRPREILQPGTTPDSARQEAGSPPP
ncbi:DNA translocase FtsK, partial [Chloroflexota bacterium]